MRIPASVLVLVLLLPAGIASAQTVDLYHATGKPLSGYFLRDENLEKWREDPDKVSEDVSDMPSPRRYMANLRRYGFADFLDQPAASAADQRDAWSLVGPVGAFGDKPRNGRISGIQIVVPEGHDPILYVGATGGGLWRAWEFNEDGGLWTDISSRLPNPSVRAFAVDPDDEEHIIIGTGDYKRCAGGGMFVTSDNGVSWTEIATPAEPRYYFRLFYQGRTSFPAHQYLVAASSAGIFLSADRGQTWTVSRYADGTSTASGCWTDLVEHPIQSNILFACVTNTAEDSRNGIYKSIDHGETWQRLVDPDLPSGYWWHRSSLAISRSDPDILVVLVEAQSQLMGIYKTMDGGATWTNITSNLDNFGRSQLYHAQAIAIHPENPDVILAGTTILARSTNGGASWATGSGTGIDIGHPDITQLYFSEEMGADFLWICNDGGIYRHDFQTGVTSSLIGGPTRGLACAEVDNLAADRAVRALGIQDNGILLSRDAGAHWLDGGVDDGADVEIYYPATGGILYCDGVYQTGPRWKTYRWAPDDVRTDLLSPDAEGRPSLTLLMEEGRVASHDTQSIYTVAMAAGRDWDMIASDLQGDEYRIKSLVASRAGDETLYVQYYLPDEMDLSILRKQPGGEWAVSHLEGLPGFQGGISCICPSREWPGEVWIGMAGLSGAKKIAHTTDFGATWEDLTNGLEYLREVKSIEVQPFNPRVLFIATNYGVMRSSNGGQDWEPFQEGLPIGKCVELRFVLDPDPAGLHTLELAMDGRGLWTRPIQGPPVVFVDRTATGEELGTREHPYHGFTSGVNGVPSGGIVAIRANDYQEAYVYQKNVIVYTWGGRSTLE